MSRIGVTPIEVPAGAEVTVGKTSITVKGPHGTVVTPLPGPISIVTEGNVLRVERKSDTKQHKSLHGLTRSLLASAVQGVVTPFEKQLDIVGVGYNAKMEGKRLTLQIGFCHPVHIDPPETVTVETPTNTRIIIRGANKQVVGQFAANVRRVRPPEPYKGKGIRYRDEKVQRKAGKSFVSGGD